MSNQGKGNDNHGNEGKGKEKTVFFIDKEKFEIEGDELSVRTLIVDYAKEDPNKTILSAKIQGDIVKYEDLEKIIKIKDGTKFSILSKEPTTVSFSGYGEQRFVFEIEQLGYKPEVQTGNDNQKYIVLRNFEISHGQFKGRVVDLAFMITNDFPRTVASSIHVKSSPHLYEIQNVANIRNITNSSLGGEWRYWSNNFQWDSEKSARRLMAQVNTIFERA